jgi:hypothetical protein
MSSSFRNTWVYPSGITELILPEHLSSHMIFSGVVLLNHPISV